MNFFFSSNLKYCLTILFVAYFFSIFGQEFFQFNDINVSTENKTFSYPWTGGVNSVQFGKVDVNHDTVKDLIVYNKSNRNFLVFVANPSNPSSYQFQPKYADSFPPISGWMVMKDYNCDGIEDIFTYNGIGNAKVYKASYRNDTIQYNLQQDGFFYSGTSGKINVYCSEVIKPAIEDINQDGDLDIISFNVFGNRLIYYENQQKELNLPCDSLFFTKSDNCWGNIQDTFSAAFDLRDTCTFKFSRLNGTDNIMHTGSCLDVFDIDQNGALDAVIGSIGLTNLTLLYNDGTANYASFLRQDINFPSNTIPVNLNSFATPTFIDVNNDQQKDLLVSTYNDGVVNFDNIWLYKNQGNGVFQFQQKNFILENTIDVGENSNPCFIDVDGDGKSDLLIGSGGLRNNDNQLNTSLFYYRNTGTNIAPAFTLTDSNFLNIQNLGVQDIVPAVGDIDNDNDTDIIIGTYDGTILLWENTSSTNTPIYTFKGKLKDNNNNDIDVGNNAAPFLIDLDKNNKTDVVIGERNGNLNFYSGDYANGNNFTLITDSLGKINIKTNGLPLGYTAPTIIDLNHDDKLDLILGTYINGLQFYDNIEDKLNQTFVLSNSTLTDASIGYRSTSTLADINDDGILELIAGNISGGLFLFSGAPNAFPTAIKTSKNEIKFSVFPNPSNSNIFIQQNELKSNYQVQLFNILGQEVLNKNYNGEQAIMLNLIEIPNGIYLLKISDKEKTGIQKIIIQH
ncbi:MAG: T9SS type A sorting domain-containing protein [Chitinophagales bacterium]|nr:T9SS type A sorting domain-containing protein [Bacteroidota bacterium]